MPGSAEDTSGDTAGDGAGVPAPAQAGSGTGRRRRAPAESAPPGVRGGHPQQPEEGGPAPERYGAWQGAQRDRHASGPRKDFVEAFADLPAPRPGTGRPGAAAHGAATVTATAGGTDTAASRTGPATTGAAGTARAPRPTATPEPAGTGGSDRAGSAAAGGSGTGQDSPVARDAADGPEGADGPGGEDKEKGNGGKGRAFAGIAAAAVTTVLAVVVAGQVAGGGSSHGESRTAEALKRETGEGPASRGNTRVTPKAAPVPLTYAKKMSTLYPLAPKLAASGDFSVVPGSAKAPGQGRKYRYRVDIEKGMGLDGTLFADAVQKTLNDKRSWAHNGARTFERVSTGHPDFVITLASPVTTAKWCAKSGLETLEENVSCDSAATDRVMINAYRWAQGSKTYGDSKIYPYRQMLINHEVGHRLGHNHVSCRTPGALAPVMQQQTKSLDIDGIKCRANPWVYPTS